MIQFKLNINMTKLTRQITNGIESGTHATTHFIRSDINSTKKNPDVYQDRGGPLTEMLEKSGLNKFTKPGALLQSWEQTVGDIASMRYANTVKINLFNSAKMDSATKWVGKTGIGKYSGKITGFSGTGRRPLPKITGFFKWVNNPYPGNGYWLLYDQGTKARDINYIGRDFVRSSYHKILDQKDFYNKNTDFNPSTIRTFDTIIGRHVQRQLR